MTRRSHPDELDRIAASGGAPAPSCPASAPEVEAALDRVLVTGRLERIPRNTRHRDIVLAILSRHVRRRHPYTEREINDHIVSALTALASGVDHVTCRRYLVDLGFLKRDRGGARYLLNYPRVEAALSAEGAQAVDALVAARVRRGSGVS